MSCLDQTELWVMCCGHRPVKNNVEVIHSFCVMLHRKRTTWVVGACLVSRVDLVMESALGSLNQPLLYLMVLLSNPGLAKHISRVRHCISPLSSWCLHCWFLRSVRSSFRSEDC